MPDAIVIGAGHNGLVAANLLADARWSVEVLEADPEPGGAVRSAEAVEPGFVHDLFSSFYPLAAASPVLRGLQLERYGVRFRHGPLVVAHPASDGSCAALSRDPDETAALLGEDGEAWRELYGLWLRGRRQLLRGLDRPLVGGAGLALALRRDLLAFARLGAVSLRRLARERFRGALGPRLLAGNALHADLAPESPLSAFYGWLLCALGQDVGFPVVEGGAGRLTEALVRRLEERGGRVTCATRVTGIVVRGGRAVGVRTERGDAAAGRAVVAAVHAAALAELLGRPLERFDPDPAAFKLDWTLDGPVPWTAEPARRAPVVHVADSLDELTVWASELARGLVPARPFLICGQYALADPARMPPGKEVLWAYTRVPHGADTEGLAERVEQRIEELAPGFRALVRGRRVSLAASVNGGTAQLHQQGPFRPGARTGVERLYLASASARPGGGVHGACGAIAARAALRRSRASRAFGR